MQSPDSNTPHEHHAVIAGTGRAGTTFLVRFLAACGVPTIDVDSATYHEGARAGLERSLLDAQGVYLVKDPWLHEYVDHVDLNSITIDALIVPVRDLRVAALSRVRQERAALGESRTDLATWSTYGAVPGGVIHSLSVSDQERLLAVGQARLLEWASSNSIPLFLPHFPRMIEDAEYTVELLSPWLSKFCDLETAIDAFGHVTSPPRWYTDVQTENSGDADDQSTIDLKARIEALHLLADRHVARIDSLEAELVRVTSERDARISSLLADAEAHAVGQLIDEVEVEGLRVEIASLREALSTREAELDTIRRSRSFRLSRALAMAARPFHSRP